ncbi:MAG: HAMP domain-containing histidine kinase [Proteobacteria bacterium]|nr:HAMP domain-containing histidine kinase [Pseudomonadota bacterium]
MSTYGLKTNIAVQIALILFFGMGLTAFMTTNLIEHLLVKSHVSKGTMLLSLIQGENKGEYGVYENHHLKKGFGPLTHRLLPESGATCALIVYPDTDTVMKYGPDCDMEGPMTSCARKAARLNQTMETKYGDGWGVFWTQKQSLILAAPLFKGKKETPGIALMIPLSPLYMQVRRAQSLIFLYVLINGILLTLAGLYQISKLVVRPVQRLLRRAEGYHGENKDLIFDEKGGNEFHRLSTALNNMLGRISDDRDKLGKTVISLEKTNRELKQAQSDIIRAEKLASIGRLSSGIAHEIGNPLGIVSGYLELLKNQSIDDDQKHDFIERAERELSRIDRIIRQLLNYSRTSSPMMTFFSVHETIMDVAEMLRIQPVMAGTTLDVLLEAKKDRIKGDSDQLRQVLMNLAINAQDAISLCNATDTGRICFETDTISGDDPETDPGPLLKISITDNGAGIPKGHLGTIFDPFFTTKEPGKGTGLGLSVCFTIIQGLGGRIHVDSEEGKGTRVDIFFPLPQSSRGQSHEKDQP